MKILDYFINVYEITNCKLNNKIANGEINKATFNLALKFLFGNKMFIETNYSNERLQIQRGVFEIDDVTSNDIIDNDSIRYLLIRDKLKKNLVNIINTLGMNYYLLLNDPENQINNLVLNI